MTDSTLDKTFDPAAIEAKWYAHWEAPDPVTGRSLFRPERPDAQPFTIVNPPPNVTGSLHIGHALDNTLQDVVIRYERLRGKDALWVVGTDHAGIATQNVVEKMLRATPGVAEATVNLASERGMWVYDPSRVSQEQIIARIGDIGYGVATAEAEIPLQGLHDEG